MSKTLEQVRDELAKQYRDKSQDLFSASAFAAGFDAALRTLSESAGEFDEKAAQLENSISLELHQQAIRTLEYKLEKAERERDVCEIALTSSEKKRRELDETRMQLRDKLAAAEARAKNNSAYPTAWDYAEHLEQRVRELERLRDEDAEIYEQALKERK